METVIYKGISVHAKEIRQKVFVEEQGFQDEFDEIDERAAHIVIFDEDKTPVATCRIFWDAPMKTYLLGRLAVMKEYRGQNIGSELVREAEEYIRKNGGEGIALHAQCRVAAFYQKLGFAEYGAVGEEEGCPHIWMKKEL